MKSVSIIWYFLIAVYLIPIFVHNRCWVYVQCQLQTTKMHRQYKNSISKEEASCGERRRQKQRFFKKIAKLKKKKSYSIVFQDLIAGRQAVFS
jgi:hypothetical protein